MHLHALASDLTAQLTRTLCAHDCVHQASVEPSYVKEALVAGGAIFGARTAVKIYFNQAELGI